jgi:hypothetical protein
VYFSLDPSEHVHLGFIADIVRRTGIQLWNREWAGARAQVPPPRPPP